MKVLQINNHHNYSGGAEKYYLDVSNLLTRHGIEVANFSMRDKRSEESSWGKYFVSNISPKNKGIINKIKLATRSVWSPESKTKINNILDDFRPDIVHIHNIHYYVSPIILSEIKKRNIPIVMTVHDYQIISPNVNLFSKGTIDETTKRHKYYKTFFNKSVRNSYSASFIAVLSSYYHWLFKTYTKNVDMFIAPSKFMKNKLIEFGIDETKIKYLPNFIEKEKTNKKILKNTNKYVLYFGRLAEHKGILDLIEIARRIPNVNFRVVGRISDDKVKNTISKIIKSDSVSNIEFINHQDQEKLYKTIDNCEFTIVPSIWNENQPYSILQSYIHGKPVIASKVGGIPEIVSNGKTGFLCNPKDVSCFTKRILFLYNHKNSIGAMKNNIEKYVKNYSSDRHYQKLINVYTSVITQNRKNNTLT